MLLTDHSKKRSQTYQNNSRFEHKTELQNQQLAGEEFHGVSFVFRVHVIYHVQKIVELNVSRTSRRLDRRNRKQLQRPNDKVVLKAL